MNVPERARGTRPKGAAARQRILRAALELFLARGFEATTVRAIGERAGVSDSALYYYFASKDDILRALLQEPAWPYSERPVETREGLRALALEQFSAWLENATLVRLTVREALDGNAVAREFSVRTTELAERRIHDAARRVLAPAEAEVVADALVAVRFGAVADALLHAGEDLVAYASSPAYRAWLSSLVDLIVPPAEGGQAAMRRVVPFPARMASGAGDVLPRTGNAPSGVDRRVLQPPSTRGRGSERTRQRILEAAAALFAERGFDGTSMKAIAARIGMSDAALYYYFRSKREVLDALWDIPELERLGAGPGGQVPTSLGDLVDAVADTLAAQDAVIRLTAVRVLSGDRTARDLREYTLARWRQFLLRWLEQRLSLPSGHVPTVADALTMAILGTTYPAQIRFGSEAPAYFRSAAYRERLLAIAELLADRRVCRHP